MRMQLIRNALPALGLAIVSTLWVEHYGFAIAHSVGLLVLAIIMAPGTLLVFFSLGASENVIMALAFLITLGYYLALFALLRKIKSKGKDNLV